MNLNESYCHKIRDSLFSTTCILIGQCKNHESKASPSQVRELEAIVNEYSSGPVITGLLVSQSGFVYNYLSLYLNFATVFCNKNEPILITIIINTHSCLCSISAMPFFGFNFWFI